MCGICGYVSFRPAAPLGAAAGACVEAMLGALAHRGPDASALHATETAVLGATRLSIRGLHDGRQPLIDAGGTVVAVCNGEIDNHREIRHWLAERGRPVGQATDVAVIPELYLELGDAFVERLIGAFAIGLWDARRQRLLLIRDRAGEKPLFFSAGADRALFASEPAALALGAPLPTPRTPAAQPVAAASAAAAGAGCAGPPAADPEALAHYLRFGCFPVPRTPFAGVQKVGPGERVAIDAGGVLRHRYWRWRQGPAPAARPAPLAVRGAAAGAEAGATHPAGTEAAAIAARTAAGPAAAPAAVERPAASGAPPSGPVRRPPTLADLDRVFRQAVARQTDVEVPCGVFLSGGVDSSLVTAVARAVRPEVPLQAFALRFPETSYDEGEVAGRVAALLGVPLAEVWVHPEDFKTCLPDLVRRAGEPLADPAWVPAALLARRAAADVRQVLVGEGGDELFGGYPTHSGVRLAELYAGVPGPLRRGLAGLVRRLPPSDRKVTVSFLLKRFVDADGLPGFERHLLWTSNIPPDTLQRLGVGPAPGDSAGSISGNLWLDPPPPGSLLDRVQQHDLEATLAEGLLTKADRASMHSALELRAPFLDRDVMELAGNLPDRERVRGLRTKVFLKRYALGYLPRWVVHRRKRGLSVPLAAWLRGPLRGWAEERLGAGLLSGAGVDGAAAMALFGEHLRRERDHARALWTLVVLAEWLDWVRGARLASAAPAALAADTAPVAG